MAATLALAARRSPAAPVVTLAEASAHALATHERIRAADADRERAAVAPWRAYSALGPSVREVGSYTREKQEIAFALPGAVSIPGFNPVVLAQDVLRSALEVGQPLYRHEFWALRDIGKARVAQSDDAYRAARQDVLLAVAAAYYDTLRGRKLIEVARETQQLADTEIDHADARVRAGEAVRTDVLRVQTERAQADQRLAEAEGDADSATDRLRRLAGYDQPFDVVEPAPRPFELGTADAFVATAHDKSPDLQGMEASLDAARGEERRRVAELYPSLGVQFDYQNVNNESFASLNGFWTLMVRAEVPLIEAGGTRWLDIAEQRAAVSSLESQVAGFRRDLDVNVRRAWVAVRTLAAQRAAAEHEVELAAETYRMLSDQYTAGVATNLDVAAALTVLDRARATLTTLRYAYDVAVVQLERETGTLDEVLP